MTKNLLLILCTFLSLQTFAQNCIPDVTLIDSAFIISPVPVPGENIAMDAPLGCPYEFVFQLIVPAEIPFQGTSAELNSVQLDTTGAILNLPVGLDYVCNPPDCFFPQETVGCILIVGTPMDTVGIYDLKLNVTATVLGGFPFPAVLPDFLGDPTVRFTMEVVDEPTDPTQCPAVNVFDQHITPFDFTLAPNPTYGTTNLTVNSERRNELTFQIISLTGAIVQRQVLQVEQGTNSFELMVQDVPEGMYLYSLGNEEGVLTDKIMITKQ